MDESTWLATVQKLGILTLDPELQEFAKAVFTRCFSHDGCTVYVCFGRLHRAQTGQFGGPAYTDHKKQLWCQHGKRHRCLSSDGTEMPAYVSDTCLKYYQNDELHRVQTGKFGGPAIIRADRMTWYYRGKVCNSNADPSMISNNGDQSWSTVKNGETRRHRLEGPAEIFANGDQKWYKYGNLHRPEFGTFGGPAKLCVSGEKSWYHENLLHRESNRPAAMYLNGTMRYARRGMCDEQRYNFHRKPIRCENPGFATYTVTTESCDVQVPYELVWQIFTMDESTWLATIHKLGILTLNRNLQRYARDTFTEICECEDIQATLLFGRIHGKLVTELETSYWRFGKLHRSADSDGTERPAYIHKHNIKAWFYRGLRHRIGGPAIIKPNKMKWYVNGTSHRIQPSNFPKFELPAVVSDRKQKWRLYGHPHRQYGPAMIKEDHVTIELRWFWRGKLHRHSKTYITSQEQSALPTDILVTKLGNLCYMDYAVHGYLNGPENGTLPAVITSDELQYWHYGIKYATHNRL